jgi:hypothetical protein
MEIDFFMAFTFGLYTPTEVLINVLCVFRDLLYASLYQ